MNVLAVVPTYLADDLALALTQRCLASMAASAPELGVMVVDDGSPRKDLMEELEVGVEKLGGKFVAVSENRGFARTVNIGLETAHQRGEHALLVNADVEFFEEGWLAAMQQELDDKETYVVGAQLLFPTGLIQHAGVYFSVLTRDWDHIYRLAPGNLPEAQKRRVCPVTAALQLIRHESLALVGLYDEGFRMGWEDVDYALRVFDNGRRCVYTPHARAIHHEKVFRGARRDDRIVAWQKDSLRRLITKHAGKNFSAHVPTMLKQVEGLI